MKTAFATLAAAMMAGGCLLASSQAAAQVDGSVTFYDQPGYRGGSVTFYRSTDNLANTGFNDRAQSAQVRGAWRMCENADYKGRCEVISGNVPDLNAYTMGGRISSLQLIGPDQGPPGRPGQPLPPPPYNDRYPGGGPGQYPGGVGQYPGGPGQYPGGQGPDNGYNDDRDEGVEGRTTVFFARPTVRGSDIAANRPRVADEFCRRSGLGQAIYFDQSERARRAVDVDGRNVGPSAVLRDVLCRK